MMNKSDINAANDEKVTCLHVICNQVMNNYIQCGVVEKLILSGADVNAKDDDNRTALFNACGVGNLELVKLLQRNGSLLDVEYTDIDGYTLLHIACSSLPPNLELIKYLIEHGFNKVINKRDMGYYNEATSHSL